MRLISTVAESIIKLCYCIGVVMTGGLFGVCIIVCFV